MLKTNAPGFHFHWAKTSQPRSAQPPMLETQPEAADNATIMMPKTLDPAEQADPAAIHLNLAQGALKSKLVREASRERLRSEGLPYSPEKGAAIVDEYLARAEHGLPQA